MAQKTLSYNEALNEIEEIVNSIEKDDLDVDDIIEKVKRVSQLLQICKKKLKQTQEDVDKILNSMDDEG
jgi:exodeoxyribonuclease VII small subunit